MLEFSDFAKAFRVHRRDSFSNVRTPVATINKTTYVAVEDKNVVLTVEEKAEIDEFVAVRKQADVLQRHLWTLTLPTYLREALEFCTTEATDTEVEFLALAVARSHQRLTKLLAQRRAVKLA